MFEHSYFLPYLGFILDVVKEKNTLLSFIHKFFYIDLKRIIERVVIVSNPFLRTYPLMDPFQNLELLLLLLRLFDLSFGDNLLLPLGLLLLLHLLGMDLFLGDNLSLEIWELDSYWVE